MKFKKWELKMFSYHIRLLSFRYLGKKIAKFAKTKVEGLNFNNQEVVFDGLMCKVLYWDCSRFGLIHHLLRQPSSKRACFWKRWFFTCPQSIEKFKILRIVEGYWVHITEIYHSPISLRICLSFELLICISSSNKI